MSFAINVEIQGRGWYCNIYLQLVLFIVCFCFIYFTWLVKKINKYILTANWSFYFYLYSFNPPSFSYVFYMWLDKWKYTSLCLKWQIYWKQLCEKHKRAIFKYRCFGSLVFRSSHCGFYNIGGNTNKDSTCNRSRESK